MNTDEKIQLYGIYVGTITAAENRRQSYSAILLTLYAATFALLGSDFAIDPIFVVPALAVISWIWWSKIRFLKKLAKSKFAVIEELEAEFEIKPFKSEWKHFKENRKLDLPLGLSDLEMAIPLLAGIAVTIWSICIIVQAHLL
ncbi:MAG: hypothetical protein DHS20C06_04250 [Hyphobacterium sp.]|nr:MAG: hypothetical protein DHS20C06_04250 [Hyphobacterium sp.]